MNEGLNTMRFMSKLQSEQCIFYARFCLRKKDYDGCKKWIELGDSMIKFYEFYMNKKPDYNPYVFFEDISFALDKDTGTKILQKYPNT